MRRGLRMTRLPAFETRHRIRLLARAADLQKRVLRDAPAGRRDSRRLARLFSIMRRPRRVAEPLALLPRRELQERVYRAGIAIDLRMPIADLPEPRRHRPQREAARIAAGDLGP